MRVRAIVAAVVKLGASVMLAGIADAAEIKVIGSPGVREISIRLVPEFEKATGHRVVTTFAGTSDVKKKTLAGEPYDVVIAIDTLIDDFIKAGDLSSARLLLQRAVEAGSMQAALTLAGTFDPNVLATYSFKDGAADIAMARLWYERAEQLGSSEAPQRLRQLASNSLQ